MPFKYFKVVIQSPWVSFSSVQFSSVQFSCSVMSHSLRPHELQPPGLPVHHQLPESTQKPCPLSQWCHPIMWSSVALFFSCLESFPALGPFPISWLFASGSQSIRTSASASVQQIFRVDNLRVERDPKMLAICPKSQYKLLGGKNDTS